MRRGSRTARAGFFAAGVGIALVLTAWPASAQTDIIPPLPLQLPSVLPSLVNQVTDTVSQTLTDATSLLQSVPEQLGGVLGGVLGGTASPPSSPGGKRTIVDPRTVPSWTGNRSPITGKVVPPSAVSATSSGVAANQHSYLGRLSDGFSHAVRRAANLAGPLAAPIVVAFFAFGLLVLAARGPGRLVKVEEQRRAFREQQSFRL